MNATIHANGKARKSLSSQIDRLDSLLDGLADGLQDAITQAVQQAVAVAVREAVQIVLTEVLVHQLLVAPLPTVSAAKPAAVEQPASPGACQRMGQCVKANIGRLCAGCSQIVTATVAGCKKATQAIVAGSRWVVKRVRQATRSLGKRVWQAGVIVLHRVMALTLTTRQRFQLVRRFYRQFLTALVVGALVGTVAFYAEPLVGAITSAVGGFTTTLLLQIGMLVRRMFVVLRVGD